MKTPEDEAFDELAKRQGDWGGGFKAKRAMAADKNKRGSIALARSLCYEIAGATNGDDDISGSEYGSVDIAEILSAEIERLREALAQPAQEPEILTIAYQSGYHDGKKAAAGREWNFCERCGKRTADLTVIHTCTPPQGDA